MTPRAARGITTQAAAVSRSPRLGERLRQLRVAAGLTQTDIAGDRFSKEYISQIERGKTRPTADTIEWLAQEYRYPEAIEEYERSLPAVLGTGAAELRVRLLNGEAMARALNGDVK